MNNFAALNVLNIGFIQFALEEEREYNGFVEQQRGRRRPRTSWVRNWLKPERRIAVGHYHQLMEELRLDDQVSFYNFLRITPPMFDELLQRIIPLIEKQDTNYRKALEPGMKLAITLRHLAKGDSYATLQYEFRVAKNTICLLVKEVCDALTTELKMRSSRALLTEAHGKKLRRMSMCAGTSHMPVVPWMENILP